MPLVRKDWITREDLQKSPEKLYVFGDNMARVGSGGQAKEMRSEPNAIGIPTKWLPSNAPDAFFKDSDFDRVVSVIDAMFTILGDHIKGGGTVVMPKDGIGTGLAKLAENAPRIAEYIDDQWKWLGDLDDPCGVKGYGV